MGTRRVASTADAPSGVTEQRREVRSKSLAPSLAKVDEALAEATTTAAGGQPGAAERSISRPPGPDRGARTGPGGGGSGRGTAVRRRVQSPP